MNARLQKYYAWKPIEKYVALFMKTFPQCWAHARAAPRKVPINHVPRGWPGEILALNLFGPLEKTEAGNEHVLVLIDHFTPWVEAGPLAKADSKAVADAIANIWVPRHKFPAVILSGNRRQFTATSVKDK